MVNKKCIYVPYDPQPSQDSIVELYRYYTSHSKSANYKKRVTWFGKSPYSDAAQLSLVEYVGEFPGRVPHGNAKNPKDYLRTPATVMDNIKSNLKEQRKPMVIFDCMNKDNSIRDMPRDVKQIRNVKYQMNKGKYGKGFKQNFADQVQQVTTMAGSSGIVKQVTFTDGIVPSVVKYTENQIADIKNICCSGKSPLSFDKTFNLGYIYVTASTYRHPAVQRISTENTQLCLDLSSYMVTPLLRHISHFSLS